MKMEEAVQPERSMIDDLPQVMGDDGEFHAQDEAVDLSGTPPEAWLALGFFWVLGRSREESLQTEQRREWSIAAHRRIITAVEKHDKSKARAEMLRHIEQVEKTVLLSDRASENEHLMAASERKSTHHRRSRGRAPLDRSDRLIDWNKQQILQRK